MGRRQLIEKAKKIPHMGAGGIGKKLMDHAAEVKENHYIVECGVWMGSGTAFLSIGADPGTKIFSYDHFVSNSSEVEKLKKWNIDIEPGQNTLSIVDENIRPFKGNVFLKKCDIKKFSWIRKPIGLFIDDVSKRQPYWGHTIKTFFPYLVPGAIVILMDFYFFKKTGRKAHKCQYMWMNRHAEFFEKLWHKDCIAAFRLKKQITRKDL
jgi:hypothetical protein